MGGREKKKGRGKEGPQRPGGGAGRQALLGTSPANLEAAASYRDVSFPHFKLGDPAPLAGRSGVGVC